MLDNIHRLGHDTFCIVGSATVYTDPFQVKDNPLPADVILISHEHYDHCSPEDVAKIVGPETIIVASAGCRGKLKGDVLYVKPGDRLNVRGIEIEAVPAYNTNKKFHPQAAGHVGYVFALDGTRIYFAGDTDHIPEMKTIRCDIAFLPVSGTYVMTVDEAVKAADDLQPKIVIPMHYGSIVGSQEDAENFKKRYKGETAIR